MDSKLQAITQIWANLTSSQKLILTFFAAGVTVAVVGLTMFASRPDYTVLFANLKAEDAAGIVQKLRDNKTLYRVSANGTAVEVPSKDVYEVRLNLAGQGLPQGGSVGFEIFDRTSLGVTDFTQKMDYVRALQGELQRTISAIDQVADARVHINIPQETIYTDKEKPASASVLLNLRQSGQINEEQVASIVNLVSASVEGLNPEHITVVDTRGKMLADGSGSSSGYKLTANQMDLKRSVENEIQQNVETMLEPVVGRDKDGNPKAVVRVNAQLALDSTEMTRETYQKPVGTEGDGMMTSDEATTEDYGKGVKLPTAAQGTPGTTANTRAATPPATAATTSAGQNGYFRDQHKRNYLLDKTVQTTTTMPGQVSKINVAVMVDKDVPMQKLDSIKKAVAAAAGITPTNGQVVVESVDFPKEAPAAKPSLVSSMSSYVNVGRNALGLIMLLVFAFMMKGALAKQTISFTGNNAGSGEYSQNSFAAQGFPGAGSEGLASSHFPVGATGDGQRSSESEQIAYPAPASLHMKKPTEDIGIPIADAQDVARSTPADVAHILRTWMSEDRAA